MNSDTNSPSSILERRVRELKRYRKAIYAPSLKNAIRRKLQTWNSGLPKKELSRHLFSLLWHDAKCHIRNFYQSLSQSPKVRIPKSSRPVIVARIEGGLGDLIIAARFLTELCKLHDLNIGVEYKTPSLASMAFARFPGFLGAICDQFDTSDYACVAKLKIGIVVQVEYLAATAPAALSSSVYVADSFSSQFKHLISHSPFLDGLLGDELAIAGFKRHEVSFRQYDLPCRSLEFLKPTSQSLENFLSDKGLNRQRYITINDGWDADFGLLNGRRPTKAMPVESLTQLIAELNATRPDLPIVQIGGIACGEDLAGTTANFRGKVDLPESAMLIAGALVHIDTEGGLVHLAQAVGTPSAVFFGPTSQDFFSYPDNLSLSPADSCSNCWWTTNTWMATCALKLDRTCMRKHDVGSACTLIQNFMAEIESKSRINQ